MLERLPDAPDVRIHTTNLVVDFANEQPFLTAPPAVYYAGLRAWATYRATPSAKYYGIDQWVIEQVALISAFHDGYARVLRDPINIANAIYVFFQMETLFAPYEDWLITEFDHQFINDDTFILTFKGIPGEKHHVRKHHLIDGNHGTTIPGSCVEVYSRQLQLGESHR